MNTCSVRVQSVVITVSNHETTNVGREKVASLLANI